MAYCEAQQELFTAKKQPYCSDMNAPAPPLMPISIQQICCTKVEPHPLLCIAAHAWDITAKADTCALPLHSAQLRSWRSLCDQRHMALPDDLFQVELFNLSASVLDPTQSTGKLQHLQLKTVTCLSMPGPTCMHHGSKSCTVQNRRRAYLKNGYLTQIAHEARKGHGSSCCCILQEERLTWPSYSLV